MTKNHYRKLEITAQKEIIVQVVNSEAQPPTMNFTTKNHCHIEQLLNKERDINHLENSMPIRKTETSTHLKRVKEPKISVLIKPIVQVVNSMAPLLINSSMTKNHFLKDRLKDKEALTNHLENLTAIQKIEINTLQRREKEPKISALRELTVHLENSEERPQIKNSMIRSHCLKEPLIDKETLTNHLVSSTIIQKTGMNTLLRKLREGKISARREPTVHLVSSEARLQLKNSTIRSHYLKEQLLSKGRDTSHLVNLMVTLKIGMNIPQRKSREPKISVLREHILQVESLEMRQPIESILMKNHCLREGQ